ncbi:acyl-CoA synthetase (AMP-forming)/AMP-acid ligase II [Williamsia limnetica]|uniref:Acyl-CoA synthetase (AMP-forming)/AMP-acid ligase II n=1 Tax=Williamsia limnetica TaxID=882452 RepID=A0A318RGM4_WILLI|nr:AMP-binding protein [Williamsia limnetica]PYE15027.1 acyl-CoA synthetase (AMP-forming)/AMP-acid ligase II [Williamsia limnetica]
MAFNLADVFETVADSVPDTIALTYEGVDHSYRQLEVEANQVAHMLTAAEVAAGEHVALFLKNSVEHVTTILGVIKIRAVPININYRYTPAELLYIFENSDSVAIVVEEAEHQDNLAQIVGEIPTLRTIFVIGDITEGLSAAAADAGVRVRPFDASDQSEARNFEPRTGDELWVLYTGGTTGYPKGVMWRHDDFFHKPLSGGNPYDENPRKDLAEVGAAAKEFPGLSFLIAAPLMHGAALYSLFTFLTLGARLVLMRAFDPEKVVRSIETDKVNVVLIVGDGMGSPLADAMEKLKDEVDLSTLFSITSGGAVWSVGVRERMLAVKPDLVLRDNFGASETGNDGAFEVRDDGTLAMPPTAKMTVLDEKLNVIPAGSGDVGMIARIGRVPLGYYRDEEKSARTFPQLPDGTRVAVLGDMGLVEADGTIVFLGRGSQCINTGGEKVYAEEVEACLHAHPAVADALVVPSPDERMGQKVSAVVAIRPGIAEPSLDEIQSHCRTMLAGYKIPRLLVIVDEIKRTPAGKADYKWAKQAALDLAGTTV